MVQPPPPPVALLVAAHGDGGADPRDETLRHLAERLARRLDIPVDWATLKRPETFAAAHARLASALGRAGDVRPLAGVAVYPLFMAQGYFSRVKLPKCLAEGGFDEPSLLPVFGLAPGLVDMIEQRLRSLASIEGGHTPGDRRIVLVAHGSASGNTGSRRAAEALAADLAYRLGTRLHLAFIEEAPFYDAVITEIRPEIVVGLFVSAGTHALDDVSAHVAATGGVRHHIAAIGTDAGVADLVEAALKDTFG